MFASYAHMVFCLYYYCAAGAWQKLVRCAAVAYLLTMFACSLALGFDGVLTLLLAVGLNCVAWSLASASNSALAKCCCPWAKPLTDTVQRTQWHSGYALYKDKDRGGSDGKYDGRNDRNTKGGEEGKEEEQEGEDRLSASVGAALNPLSLPSFAAPPSSSWASAVSSLTGPAVVHPVGAYHSQQPLFHQRGVGSPSTLLAQSLPPSSSSLHPLSGGCPLVSSTPSLHSPQQESKRRGHAGAPHPPFAGGGGEGTVERPVMLKRGVSSSSSGGGGCCNGGGSLSHHTSAYKMGSAGALLVRESFNDLLAMAWNGAGGSLDEFGAGATAGGGAAAPSSSSTNSVPHGGGRGIDMQRWAVDRRYQRAVAMSNDRRRRRRHQKHHKESPLPPPSLRPAPHDDDGGSHTYYQNQQQHGHRQRSQRPGLAFAPLSPVPPRRPYPPAGSDSKRKVSDEDLYFYSSSSDGEEDDDGSGGGGLSPSYEQFGDGRRGFAAKNAEASVAPLPLVEHYDYDNDCYDDEDGYGDDGCREGSGGGGGSSGDHDNTFAEVGQSYADDDDEEMFGGGGYDYHRRHRKLFPDPHQGAFDDDDDGIGGAFGIGSSVKNRERKLKSSPVATQIKSRSKLGGAPVLPSPSAVTSRSSQDVKKPVCLSGW